MRGQLNKIKHFSFNNGEKHAVLVNVDTGKPLYYQNLYVTIYHRNKGDALNTIVACLGYLKYLDMILNDMGVKLYESFIKGEMLSKPQMESILYWAKKPISEFKINNCIKKSKNIVKAKIKRIELSRQAVMIDENIVDVMTTYNKFTVFMKYTVWLAKTLSPKKNIKDIEEMESYLLNLRPSKPNRKCNSRKKKSISDAEILRILDVVRSDSNENPWVNIDVRYRNQMIINILHDAGCRKGELLNLKATDVDSGKGEIVIEGSMDDPEETRNLPPSVKTEDRVVPVSSEVFVMIQNYIMYYRSKIRGSNKNKFLILSSMSDGNNAKPLSMSGLDKIFNTLNHRLSFKVNPHAFRHRWNNVFSQNVEESLMSGEMTTDEVEKLRCYLMGWVEGSDSAKYYTEEFNKKRAFRVGLALQEKERTSINRSVGNYDEDITM